MKFVIVALLLDAVALVAGEVPLTRNQLYIGAAEAIEHKMNALIKASSVNETEETVLEAIRETATIVYNYEDDDYKVRLDKCITAIGETLNNPRRFCGNYVYLADHSKLQLKWLGVSSEAVGQHLHNWNTENWSGLKRDQKGRYIIALFSGEMPKTTTAATSSTTATSSTAAPVQLEIVTTVVEKVESTKPEMKFVPETEERIVEATTASNSSDALQ